MDVNNVEPVAFDELLANNQAFHHRHADTAFAEVIHACSSNRQVCSGT